MKTLQILIAIVIWLIGSHVIAQQDAQFTQYNDNMLYYNPAYAGNKGCLELSAIHRQQWVGIKGAPMSQTFAVHTPLRYKSVGVGVNVLNDKVGPMNQTWFNVDMSYSLRFKNKSKLSFGINAGFNMLNANFSELDLVDEGDALLSQDMRNVFLPNLGVGTFYRAKHFYAGFAIPRILESKTVANALNYNDQRHYYFSAGGYFDISERIKGRPSAMLKFTDNAPFALDASMAFVFNDKFWLGANYRLAESAGVLVQFQLTDQFKVGYTCDISTSKLVRYNYGTHEILLSYMLYFKHQQVETTRCFYF